MCPTSPRFISITDHVRVVKNAISPCGELLAGLLSVPAADAGTGQAARQMHIVLPCRPGFARQDKCQGEIAILGPDYVATPCCEELHRTGHLGCKAVFHSSTCCHARLTESHFDDVFPQHYCNAKISKRAGSET